MPQREASSRTRKIHNIHIRIINKHSSPVSTLQGIPTTHLTGKSALHRANVGDCCPKANLGAFVVETLPFKLADINKKKSVKFEGNKCVSPQETINRFFFSLCNANYSN